VTLARPALELQRCEEYVCLCTGAKQAFDEMSPMKTVKMLGQRSWRLQSDSVDTYVTCLGGMVGPTAFSLKGKVVRPYAVAPWAEEKPTPAVTPQQRAMRGDFFCLPFGFDRHPYRGERHPPAGEAAHGEWRFDGLTRDSDRTTLRLSFATRIRRGLITKEVTVANGQTALYQRHTITGMRGLMDYGHHAMLRFPPEEGSGRVSTSRLLFGQVRPGPSEIPAKGGYSCLKPGVRFSSLQHVPLANGGYTDISVFPAREGFDDVVILASDPSLPLAWTAATFPGQKFVWFSLKDPKELSMSLFWMSNGGKHYAPWNGRQKHVMALEEIMGLPMGLTASIAPNLFSRAGVATKKMMNPNVPTVVRSIHGVASIPAGFDAVASLRSAPGGVELRSKSGRLARAEVDLDFLA
jgi:hypothetical protein